MHSVSKGSIYRQKGSRNWFIKFYVDRELKRETAGTPDREQALAFLKRRVDEASMGRYLDVGERITWGEMRALLLEDYKFKGNRTDPVPRLARLTEYFGTMLGEQITAVRIKEYSKKRLAEGAAPATLRRELAILKRMLRLASERLPRVPLVVLPPVHNARQGFFEEADLQAILPHLPEHTRNSSNSSTSPAGDRARRSACSGLRSTGSEGRCYCAIRRTASLGSFRSCFTLESKSCCFASETR